MPRELDHTRLLRAVGILTWALVGAWLLNVLLDPEYLEQYLELSRPELMRRVVMPWLGCYLAFGAGYGWLTRRLGERRIGWSDQAMLLVVTLCALGVTFFSENSLGSILMMVLAGLLPWLLPARVALAWMLIGNLAFVPMFTAVMNVPIAFAIIQALLYAGFSGLVFATAHVARKQVQAGEAERRINAELRATRALLAESARMNERTRIARDLHDLLGHHLTALSMNLEVAGHLTDGKAQQHVRQAHQLARLLLTDVREAVSQLREGGAIELEPALRALAEHVPGLEVRLEIEHGLHVEDAERAHVLLRATQEVITNAARHAGARHLDLRYRQEGGWLLLHAHDDGRGAPGVAPGNGLTGMRERLAEQGGRLDITTAPGAGFALELALPVARLPLTPIGESA